MKERYGLIGYPLGHSFSQKYFTQKFNNLKIDAVYDLLPIQQISQLGNILDKYDDLCGFNVTIPHKQAVLSKLNSLSDEAALIKAVNTVKVTRSESGLHLRGYNTDAPAFESELLEFTSGITGNALIFGTGGASAAVAYVLKKHGWEFKFVSRNPMRSDCIGYNSLTKDLLNENMLLVNTTPLGMFSEVTRSPDINYAFLGEKHFLFDLVYNPELTVFLERGQQQGAKIRNGLGMLHKQAEYAWSIWQDNNNLL